MGCFSIHQRRSSSAKHKLATAAPFSSPMLPSLNMLRELKLGDLSFQANTFFQGNNASSCSGNSSRSNKDGNTHHRNALQGLSSPYARSTRKVIRSASSKLVRIQPRALAGPSCSFNKAQKHGAQRREDTGRNRPVISFSAPITPSAINDKDGEYYAHRFPLPLPPAATPTASTSDDVSSQFVSSTGSGSSSSSSSSVPFPGRAVKSLSQNNRSYNNPTRSRSVTECTNSTEFTNASLGCTSARPLPLPPALNIGSSLREFSYDEIAGACLNFAPEFLIRDSCAGPVFRATVRGTSDEERAIDIAVTRLSTGHTDSFKKWRAEVGSLARLSHPNVCKVLGFSRDDSFSSSDKMAVHSRQRERLLVYEHTSNGSLESLLYSRKSRAPLDWESRIIIAQGAAEGLTFLHERLPRQVIYKSFRTLNIQVDLHSNAKLSDYGFARSFKELPRSLPLDDPYAAPETTICDEISAKSNVWSFGIVLLELLTGRQNMDDLFGPEEKDLLKWCRPYLLDPNRLYVVMDPELKGRYSSRKAKMVADLALHCLMEDPVARPSMRDVWTSLSSHISMNNGPASNVNHSFTKSGMQSTGHRYNNSSYLKSRYSKSYNLVSVLASPGRSFVSNLHSHDSFYSPAHYSTTRFRGFLSGEMTGEASHSSPGCRGDQSFLSRAGFLPDVK